jgi:hypothetical protein
VVQPQPATGGRGRLDGASVRSAIGSVISACGSHISMFFGWLDTGEANCAGLAERGLEASGAMSRVSVLPPGVLARPARRPSMSRS